jgi:hypothetical protein
MPMEAVELCAGALVDWLDAEVDAWHREQKEMETEWTNKSQ